MNQLVSFLASHASVRKFQDYRITDTEEECIVTTAQRSPTSSNLQAYSIIGIRNDAKKQELARLCGNQRHVEECSLFLVFCADLYRLSRINANKGYSFSGGYTELFVVATVDTALVACRALMAAQAIGLGGVMVGSIRNDPQSVGELLRLPDLVYPVMGMSLGKPAADAKIKPRLPLDAVYHREAYSEDHFASLVATYDREIAELGYLKGREVMPEQFSEFRGEYSWSEHSARRMTEENRSALRVHMKSFLESKGFLRE